MNQARCMRCRVLVPIQNEEQVVTKNGRKALKGKCSKCGTTLFKIIG